jgi:hypothetical protein
LALAALQASTSIAAPGAPTSVGWAALGHAGGKPDATAGANAAGLAWDLAGRDIEITGYVLPVDRDCGLVHEFILVPWAGACSHAAQPPPNQVVRVTPDRPYPLSRSYERVSISGRIKPGLEKTQLFIMDGVAVVESGYSIGRARVAAAEGPELAPTPGPSPWKFLK